MKSVLITPRSYGKFNMAEMLKKFKDNNIEAIIDNERNILTEEQVSKKIENVDGIIVGVDPLNSNVLAHAKKLKAISKYGVGTDNIDLNYAASHNISVSSAYGANTHAVADYTIALMLASCRKIVEINNACIKGDWSKKIAIDLYGKNVGILGLGAVGREVVKRLKGFDVKIYAYDILLDENYINENNIIFTDVDTIIKECDFISLHMPLTDENFHILNKDNLKNAKSNLIIINTARGALIDEDALATLIEEKVVLGAGIDVFEREPPEDSKLIGLENVVLGSHAAASSVDSINLMSFLSTENIIEALK